MVTVTKDCYSIQQNPFLRFLLGLVDFGCKLRKILKGDKFNTEITDLGFL
jgi:hypothetical protein